MHKYLGYESFIANYNNCCYQNLKLLLGFWLEFIQKIYSDFERDALKWLRVHFKQIDILNVFHYIERSKRFILLYKKLNPSGKVYLKLDGVNSPKNYENT